ncbi:PREDICTED: carbonic anhydrase 2 isoform X3 [Vollenhovia emeryi]|uniref:carbonic anhydrase 2 isoform X3 n=1 Tax=Vollenhovia emeryi TaxID=411798 RepID=UPI0005F3D490|nr:PREDICTED: carbonic anhydrase 2 isoform X3 [Vollenhovia emeryi]
MVLSVVCLSLLLLSGFCRGQDFSYEGSLGEPGRKVRYSTFNENNALRSNTNLVFAGPSHWGEEFHTCVGKHQSPINIEEHNVKSVNLPPLKLTGIDNPCQSYVTNNGHTVMLKTNESKVAVLSGGPLRDNVYVFEQLHFHWGENDYEGSEDLMNNHSFPMEMHAVFYKEDYKSIGESLKHDDGLAVLSYWYELAAFRDLRTAEGNKLTHNFRPVQPLEDRVVLHNIPKEQDPPGSTSNDHNFDGHSGQRGIKVPILFVALGALVAIFLFAM